ncbi:MAG: hypothetical protein JSS04_07520, partial [Proteobacteria bacterium]|nr:hypothetical protein [Pseudomonadota bacterium]
MSIVKFEQERQPPDFPPERPDLRIYYEELVAHTLVSILRQRRFIALLVSVALAAAFLAIPLIPRKYSAEALVYPNLLSNEQEKGVPVASSDASSIVNGEARLILSDAIVAAVVKQLGLDRDLETARSHGWVAQTVDWLRARFLPETHNESSFDRAVAALRNHVGIMKDPRSYFISISFTARSPDEAVRVVNGFALEYVRAKSMQQRAAAVTAAERDLRRQRAIYGDKHPKVLQAEDELVAARAVQKAISNSEDGRLGDLVSEETVKLAIPNRTPTSPKGSMILGLTFALSLLAGIGLAVWRDRNSFSYGNPKGRRPRSRGNRRGKKGTRGRGARRKSPLLKIWSETTDAARARLGNVVSRLPGRSAVRSRIDNARSTLTAAIGGGQLRLAGPASPSPSRRFPSLGFGAWVRRMTNRVDSIPGEGGHVLGQRSATLVDQCIVSGGSFLLNVLLARSLAAADYGEFALFLGGVFVLRQIDGSLVSFPLSVRLSLEAEDDRPGLLGKTALLSALLSLVLATAMAVGIALLCATEILLPACLCFLCWQAQEASRRFLFAEFRYREAVI